jgi:hypothetical protein
VHLPGSNILRQTTSVALSTLVFSTKSSIYDKPRDSNNAKANHQLYHSTDEDCGHVATGNRLFASFLGTFLISAISHASQFYSSGSVLARYSY